LPGTGEDYSLATDAQGQVWAANVVTGKLWRLRPDGPPEPQPGPYAGIVAPDRDGMLLVGGKRTIQRRGPGAVEEIPLPPGRDGKPADLTMLGIRDDGKILWTSTLETGLIGWQGGRWLPRSAFRLPQKIYQSASGAPGQLWLATGDGTLYAYDAERGAGKPMDVHALGMVAAIFPGPELVLSGDGGLGLVRDGTLHLVSAAEPEVLRNVSGFIATQASCTCVPRTGGAASPMPGCRCATSCSARTTAIPARPRSNGAGPAPGVATAVTCGSPHRARWCASTSPRCRATRSGRRR
jgi:hypothetical protein